MPFKYFINGRFPLPFICPNARNSYPFTYLKPKNGTPFGQNLPVLAIIGSTPLPRVILYHSRVNTSTVTLLFSWIIVMALKTFSASFPPWSVSCSTSPAKFSKHWRSREKAPWKATVCFCRKQNKTNKTNKPTIECGYFFTRKVLHFASL